MIKHGSSGGSGFSVWNADVIPTWDSKYVPEYSYERGLTHNFIEWDPGGLQTVEDSEYGLKVTNTGVGQSGLINTIPAILGEEYSITINMSYALKRSNYSGAGIVVGADLINNPSTAKFLKYSWIGDGANAGMQDHVFTNYNTFYNAPHSWYGWGASYTIISCFMRVSVNSAHDRWRLAVSSNGRNWAEVSIIDYGWEAHLAWTRPLQFGLCYTGSGGGNLGGDTAEIGFIRFRKGSGSYRDFTPEGGLT